MAAGLRAIGARVEEREDGLIIDGSGGDTLPGGATIAGHPDHRICMSFAVAGLARKTPVTVDDIAPVATSFPNFEALLAESPASTGGCPAPPRLSSGRSATPAFR